jgi:hypothetical protein
MAPRWYTFDATEFVLSCGGWGFFGPPDLRPSIELSFAALDDPAEITVHDLRLRLGWHPVTRCRAVAELTATVEGRADSQGNLIESPSGILRELLTAPDLGGTSAAELHGEDWAAVESAEALAGARFARRIAAPVPLDEWLASVAIEAGLSLRREAAAWRLRVLPRLILADLAAAPLQDADLCAVSALQGMPIQECVFEVEILGRDARGREVRLAWVEGAGDAMNPGMSRLARIRSVWCRADPSGRALARRFGELLIDRSAGAGEWIEVEVPLTRTALERGDAVTLSGLALQGFPRAGEIERVAVARGGMALRLGIRLAPALVTVWSSLDGRARLEARSDGTALLFVIDGRVVARVGSGGALRLAGELIARGTAPVPVGDALTWNSDTGTIGFGAGPAGSLQRVALLDASGTLRVSDDAEEHASMMGTMDPPGWDGASGEDLVFSPDRGRIAARFTAAGALRLAGEIIERDDPG